ncbi:GNAT family N-acetyltransferase [Pseudoxanthomonas taiwanensis]|nr:N-acetyltransferase [Pseudoxanthomonas taiwanensis]RRN80991.1 N-acetyltransferase [Pseudoxanthomonas sp. SGD-10]
MHKEAAMWIREEGPGDADAICTVLRAAFAGFPGAGQLEARTVDSLRLDDALAVSLLADIDGRVAGYVAFSPARPSRDGDAWYVLGPLAVDPADQGHGIGSALVHAGLLALQERQANGCVVLGDPAYYGRFGFVADPLLTLPGAPQGAFQALRFTDAASAGEVVLHPAFGHHEKP